MNPFLHTSASQMDTFADAEAEPFVGGEGCNRAWWFEKILGLPKPASDSAKRGSLIHKRIEDHLLRGADLTDDLRRHVARYLPPRAEVEARRVLVEKPIKLLVGSTGIDLVGYVDLWARLKIEDWKTSADTKWFKSKEEIAKNTQMLLYGYVNALEFSMGKDTVSLAHNQLLVPKGSTTVTYAQRTETTVPVSATLDFWKKRAIPLTERMKEVALLEDASLVTPNWNACGRFGGCAFRDRCAALKGAGAAGPARNPFASRASLPVDPTDQETPVAIIRPPVITNPALAAAVGRAQTPANGAAANPTPPATASAAAQATSPGAQSVGALPAVVGQATGVTPPDAPTNAKPGMPTAPSTPTTPAAPATFSEKQKSQILLDELGWSATDIETMSPECFEKVFAVRAKRAEVDVVTATDDQGEYLADFTPKPPPPPPVVEEPKVETPATPAPRRGVARVVEGERRSKRVGAPKLEETARRPRNAAPRLQKLGYSEEQIGKMSTNTMEDLLAGDTNAKDVSVLPDGTAEVFFTVTGTVPQSTLRRLEQAEAVARGEVKLHYYNSTSNGWNRYFPAQITDHHTYRGFVLVGDDADKAEFLAAKAADEKGDTVASRIYGFVVSQIAENRRATQEEWEALKAEMKAAEPPAEPEVRDNTPDEILAEKDQRINELEQTLASIGGELDKAKAAMVTYAQRVTTLEADLVRETHRADSIAAEWHAKSAEGAAPAGFTLYVDCAPGKGEGNVVLFDDFIAPHHKAVAEANGVTHIQEADKLFGRGPGMIAARFLLAANRPAAGTALVVWTDHPLAPAAVAELAPFAARVVRGGRR